MNLDASFLLENNNSIQEEMQEHLIFKNTDDSFDVFRDDVNDEYESYYDDYFIKKNDFNFYKGSQINSDLDRQDMAENRDINKTRKKNPKRKVVLNESESLFKNYYFSIFTRKKKFRKEYVQIIHNYMRQFLKLPKMTRDEVRISDLYFKKYEPVQIQILTFLKKNRKLIYNKFLSESIGT